MRRLGRLLVAASLAASVLAASPVRAAGPCDLELRDGERVAHRMARIIRCSVRRWPVRGGADRAVCIAQRESGLDPKAKADHGAYLGIYQHRAVGWLGRYETWTRRVWHLDDSALIGRTNIVVAIRMANASGWGGWGVEGC